MSCVGEWLGGPSCMRLHEDDIVQIAHDEIARACRLEYTRCDQQTCGQGSHYRQTGDGENRPDLCRSWYSLCFQKAAMVAADDAPFLSIIKRAKLSESKMQSYVSVLL